MPRSHHRSRIRCATGCACALALAVVAGTSGADPVDLPTPAGSTWFGREVAVLPNGNLVVGDPLAHGGVGAAHLFSPDGTLISTLTGSTPGDATGFRILVLADGDFLVASPGWTDPATGLSNAGAVTRVDGETGRDGVVTAANSLVGSSEQDFVGLNLQALPGGGWAVQTLNWDNGALEDAGAVTVVPAGGEVIGPVSGFNSLVGTTAGDRVGSSGFVVLATGNVVVCSAGWDNGALQNVGAATFVDSSVGIAGPVSATNSLVGSTANDTVGSTSTCAAALANGHYVVRSPFWDRDGIVDAGAATWADGHVGRVGEVSASNSLVGSQEADGVGAGITALSNGHYVVTSPSWSNGAVADVGAATWGNGDSGTVGEVGTANSLVGVQAADRVAWGGATPLENGHYVVGSHAWSNGAATAAGAATWRDGSGPAPGTVSSANSLVGTMTDSMVGLQVVALANGHYVVLSPRWDGAGGAAGLDLGAASWGNGQGGTSGVVSAANSLVGSTADDEVGEGVLALSNGDYLVLSDTWDNGSTVDAGAVTWADGGGATTGVVSTANSFVGPRAGDRVGLRAAELSSGKVALASPYWNGPGSRLGAITVLDPGPAMVGAVTSANSLHGTHNDDFIGILAPLLLQDGSFAVRSPYWDNGTVAEAGAVTLLPGDGSATGPVDAANSVFGTVEYGGEDLVMAADAVRNRLVVGLPRENRVVLLALPSDAVFADGFEP